MIVSGGTPWPGRIQIGFDRAATVGQRGRSVKPVESADVR